MATTPTPRARLSLLVINWLDWMHPRAGGAEVHLRECLRRLVARGHRVTLLASAWPGAASRLRVDGVDVHRIAARHTFAVAAPLYYRRRWHAGEFDVLVEDLNKLPLASPWWAREPVAVWVHHLFGASAFRAAAPPVAALTVVAEATLAVVYRHQQIVGVSPSTAANLVRRGFAPGRITVIPNGVDVGLFHAHAGARSPTPMFVYVGRAQPYKRLDVLLRAHARLVARNLPARLVIAGEGRCLPQLRRLVAKLATDRLVEFPGFASEEEKRRLFQQAWANVVCSSKEGWGLTCMEAAACGTPTVASFAPGLRDAVLHEYTGLLVRHADPTHLADALARLMREAGLVKRLGTRARARAERFSWDEMTERIEAHLLAVVRGERPSEAGLWSELQRQHPWRQIPLEANGPPDLPFGYSEYGATLLFAAGRSQRATMQVGASDPEGHAPVLRFLPDGLVAWTEPLEGWPQNPERYLAAVLQAKRSDIVRVSVERVHPRWIKSRTSR